MMNWIYRFQNEDGVGPYSVRETLTLPAQGKTDVVRPLPEKDGIVIGDEDMRFGFQTMDQLFDWFGEPESLLILRATGFHVVRLWVPSGDVVQGGHQCAFDPRCVMAVGSFTWTDIFNALVVYRNR